MNEACSFLVETVLQGKTETAARAQVFSDSQWNNLLLLAQQNTVLLRLAARLGVSGVVPPGDFQVAIEHEKKRVQEALVVIQRISDICRQASTIFVLTKAFQHDPDMGHDIDLFVLEEGREIDRLISREIHWEPGNPVLTSRCDFSMA